MLCVQNESYVLKLKMRAKANAKKAKHKIGILRSENQRAHSASNNKVQHVEHKNRVYYIKNVEFCKLKDSQYENWENKGDNSHDVARMQLCVSCNPRTYA